MPNATCSRLLCFWDLSTAIRHCLAGVDDPRCVYACRISSYAVVCRILCITVGGTQPGWETTCSSVIRLESLGDTEVSDDLVYHPQVWPLLWTDEAEKKWDSLRRIQ